MACQVLLLPSMSAARPGRMLDTSSTLSSRVFLTYLTPVGSLGHSPLSPGNSGVDYDNYVRIILSVLYTLSWNIYARYTCYIDIVMYFFFSCDGKIGVMMQTTLEIDPFHHLPRWYIRKHATE